MKGSRRPSPIAIAALLAALTAARGAAEERPWEPRPYAVTARPGRLVLETPYAVFEHDLSRGGAIAAVRLANGKAANILAAPVETSVRLDDGAVYRDVGDPNPRVERATRGSAEVVEVECELRDSSGRASGIRLRSAYEYRWGFVRVRKEIVFPEEPLRVREVCAFAAALAPSLSEFGYREGTTEAEGAPPFSFGSCRWGRVAPTPGAAALSARHVPRYLVFADPGVEGIEWFVGSDLHPWESALAGRRGAGLATVERGRDPDSILVRVSPLRLEDGALSLAGSRVLEYRLGVPLHAGRASRPWFHATFHRNRGEWVSEETIRAWASSGVRTVHCHNDGDYHGDGIFWRDGSYPPYPPEDMAKFDRTIEACRVAGIRVATYFSGKELHPSTREFQERGSEWARKDAAGNIQHNFYRPGSEFGAQMCLRSGWLEFLEFSIDRVLSRHPLDGVYYDWNVALYCANPLHEARGGASGEGEATAARGHWDVDELLEFMEWTRKRVGPDGVIIVHNTTTPMLATENFANYVVATEWGYKTWSDAPTRLEELPLEWSFAGARPRGVISYGLIPAGAPRRFHRVFALEALVSGVTPWPAGPDAFDVFRPLAAIGEIESFRFFDWRRPGARLEGAGFAASSYGRPGEAFLVVANLEGRARPVRLSVRASELPHPLPELRSAEILEPGGGEGSAPRSLDAARLGGEGLEVEVPADGTVLIRLR